MSDTTTKPKRLPRTTQGDSLVPALVVEVFLNDEQIGAIEAPQEDLLSKNGNVLFRGAVSRGWRLPGEVAETLSALSFKVNGLDAKASEKGVHLTAPRTSEKTGKVIPDSGGEHIVSHFIMLDASTTDEPAEFMVNLHAKKIKKAKAGQDQGYSLRVQAFPKGSGAAAGPQVVGSVSGLTVS